MFGLKIKGSMNGPTLNPWRWRGADWIHGIVIYFVSVLICLFLFLPFLGASYLLTTDKQYETNCY